jgi:aryl-alcohol dehydrogenase-like predicted oxidoreductase
MGVMNADNPNLVKAALDSGIMMLDTAHGYQKGRNEEMIGKAVKDYQRDSFVIATKVGHPTDRKTGLYPADTTPSRFLDEFDISLKRLQMDYVDILYIHGPWVRETVFFEPVMKALEEAKKDGKARFVGLTTHRNEEEMIKCAIESKFYDVVLTAYNFRHKNRNGIREAIAQASAAGIGIVAMKTQAGVYWDREKQDPINMKAALKWALQEEGVHTSIPGFTTFDQLSLDLSVMEDITLTPEEIKELKLETKTAPNGLYCQQCGECTSQCPENLDIPTLMRSYMYAYGYKNLFEARSTLMDAGLPVLPCSSPSCSTCAVNCTMGFDVKEKILDIARLRSVSEDFLG